LRRVEPQLAALAERNFDIVSDIVLQDVSEGAGTAG
jgi:hypothetical protein